MPMKINQYNSILLKWKLIRKNNPQCIQGALSTDKTFVLTYNKSFTIKDQNQPILEDSF